MAEWKLSRFRYTWRGNWQTTRSYNRDDIVYYGGSSWVCIRQHTSTSFLSDQEFLANESDTDFSPAWINMTSGSAWRGAWIAGYAYAEGDIVRSGGRLYICTTKHVSGANIDANLDAWAVFVESNTFLGSWQELTRYSIGDIVAYGGTVYICIEGHTSDHEVGEGVGGLEANQSSWIVFFEGVEYVGEWVTDQRYRVNDLVKYGGSVYRCILPHVSGDDSTLNFDSESFWQLEFSGKQYQGIWSSTTTYAIGDVVRHGGYLYVCLKDSYGDVPSSAIYQTPEELFWALISKGVDFKGDWSATTAYKTGDVVRRGGRLYVAKLDTAQSAGDGSTLDYLDDSNWELITEGYNWRSVWVVGRDYNVGDLVSYLGQTFRCNEYHTATLENFPGDNGSGFNYWDMLVESASQVGMSQPGDLLTYNLSRLNIGDGSTLGATNIPIGNFGQVLTIDSQIQANYKDFDQSSRFFYVALNGTDDTTSNRGSSPNNPWRTVRFACEQADDGYQGHTTIFVTAGEFEEVLPIIVPKKTVVLGTELRTTTITAKPANSRMTIDSTYSIAGLVRINDILTNVLSGTVINKTSGNTLSQTVLTTEIIDGEGISTQVPITVSGAAIESVQNLITNIISYINFYINSSGSAPTLFGSNTAVTEEGYVNAVSLLEANKSFLAEEAVEFVKSQNLSYSFDEEQCKRDIRAYIDAWKYDIIYTGNYKSLLGARYYRNAVLGSLTEDMFYVRDATGIRNCTLKGLQGILNPPLTFDLYQLPTGGAYVSLDPGWGPADDRTWILTRSPYIQGVTTIGTACTGQKIDGSLHNGGNKSIVSNDFTQVLSDGIGAWVSNNGRAELVSVFTYYCHIGYLTTDGGIIRATNGNNSYGTYGSVADGTDPTEDPIIASINARNQQATVASAFAGEFTDEIQILEWSNAGERYTEADAVFAGAGANAAVLFEDFRDDAVFQMLVQDSTPTATGQTLGGSGYFVVQNNAQPGEEEGSDLISITLAASDANEEENYLGMRLIITGGTGTGQYGYITAYDSTLKIASISRESDNEPGWDNVIPGRPVESVLDTTTTYRIEPRPVISDPGININTITASASSDWCNAVYGEITQSFDRRDPNGTARFLVSQTGRTYNVEISVSGTGYTVGDVITISGTNLEGATPDNDVTITVTEVSDDSTNSILDFEFEGLAPSGHYIVVTRGGNTVMYSKDATTWENTVLPSSGDWLSLAAGNNRFVAIRNNSNQAAYSFNGVTWIATTMPANRLWSSVVYAYGRFVAVSSNQNTGAYSDDGINWFSMTMPTIGDSSTNEWVDVTAGKNKYVAIANSQNISAYSEDGITWNAVIMDVIDDSSQKDWVSVTYGNNRFVAISTQGDVAYSFDGLIWLSGTMPSQDGETAHFWYKIRYGQGTFFAVGDTGGRNLFGDPADTPSTFSAISVDGVNWNPLTLDLALNWRAVAFGSPYINNLDSTLGKSSPIWIAVARNTNRINKLRIGVKALARPVIETGRITSMKIWNCGSGYIEPPSISIIDPNNVSDAVFECRIGDGVLSEPSWLNRGLGYRTTTTRVTISGDGYADEIPVGSFITISGLDIYPGPGAQITLTGNERIYTVSSITELGNLNGGLSARFRISPSLRIRDRAEHGTQATIRIRYSQNRITGHDFLDIGTGNFEETNYPELYATGLYVPAPENEVYEESGGRVFYTATDQSGNFRTGELFAVEQATGIVTISADFFDLAGLSELRLGGVRLGGTGAVIREFSTDPLFTEDSNNIVPTQRAISRYLQNRLTVGGSEIATASFIAGVVRVGPDLISSTIGTKINIPVRADFNAEFSGIRGSMLAYALFHRAR